MELEDRPSVAFTDGVIVGPANESSSDVVNEPASESNTVPMNQLLYHAQSTF